MAACEILTFAVPVLVTLTVCVALLPTATFPKTTAFALGDSTPAAGFAGFPGFPGVDPPPVVDPPPDAAVVYPAQLDNATLAMMRSKTDIGASKLLPLPQGIP